MNNEHVCRLDGRPCDKHAGQIHGQEAEELRRGIEKILEDYYNVDSDDECDIDVWLRGLLDKTDARDSLAFLERKKAERKRLEQSVMNEAKHLIRRPPDATSSDDQIGFVTAHQEPISDKRIFKYELQPSYAGTRYVFMPLGARVISAGWQGGKLCVWAIVDDAKQMVTREFKVVATGELFPEMMSTAPGIFGYPVFHVRTLYDETPEELFVFDVGA